MKELLNFGAAILAAKEGKRIARKGWNGKDMFVFIRPADTIPVKTVVETIKSLPVSVKQYYKDKYGPYYEYLSDGSPIMITFGEYLCMKASDGTIVNGWLASQTDILATDWVSLD